MYELRGNTILCRGCGTTDTVNRRDPNSVARWKRQHRCPTRDQAA